MNQSCVEGLSLDMLDRVARMLRLLAHPYRLKMVEYLRKNDNAPVHDISDWVHLSPAATSQHLNQMKNMGLVNAQRHGKEVWYSIADRRCISILDCIQAKARYKAGNGSSI